MTVSQDDPAAIQRLDSDGSLATTIDSSSESGSGSDLDDTDRHTPPGQWSCDPNSRDLSAVLSKIVTALKVSAMPSAVQVVEDVVGNHLAQQMWQRGASSSAALTGAARAAPEIKREQMASRQQMTHHQPQSFMQLQVKKKQQQAPRPVHPRAWEPDPPADWTTTEEEENWEIDEDSPGVMGGPRERAAAQPGVGSYGVETEVYDSYDWRAEKPDDEARQGQPADFPHSEGAWEGGFLQ